MRIIVENCKIKNNRANGYGGGVHLECISATNSYDAGTFYNVEITNSIIKRLPTILVGSCYFMFCVALIIST